MVKSVSTWCAAAALTMGLSSGVALADHHENDHFMIDFATGASFSMHSSTDKVGDVESKDDTTTLGTFARSLSFWYLNPSWGVRVGSLSEGVDGRVYIGVMPNVYGVLHTGYSNRTRTTKQGDADESKTTRDSLKLGVGGLYHAMMGPGLLEAELGFDFLDSKNEDFGQGHTEKTSGMSLHLSTDYFYMASKHIGVGAGLHLELPIGKETVAVAKTGADEVKTEKSGMDVSIELLKFRASV